MKQPKPVRFDNSTAVLILGSPLVREKFFSKVRMDSRSFHLGHGRFTDHAKALTVWITTNCGN